MSLEVSGPNSNHLTKSKPRKLQTDAFLLDWDNKFKLSPAIMFFKDLIWASHKVFLVNSQMPHFQRVCIILMLTTIIYSFLYSYKKY